MIRSHYYRGQTKVKKEGKEEFIPIQPPNVLQTRGPFIDIIITQPRTIAEKLKDEGKDIPAVKVRALIDTGAYSSAITPRVAKDLGLIQNWIPKSYLSSR